MFASLDRLDIVLRPDADGRKRYVQVDGRTRPEVEAEPDLSVLFAVMRVLSPMRTAGANEPRPIVWYSVVEQPPEFLSQAINAAGGQLILGAAIFDPIPVGTPPPLQGIVNTAMNGLVRATMTEHCVPLSLEGLVTLEETLAKSAGHPDDDAYKYWSAVVKLGSFAGELIRASNGGRWEPVSSGTLPLALITNFKGEEVTCNPLGKAIKRFQNGTEDSLVCLVRAVQSNSTKSNEDYRFEVTRLEEDPVVWNPERRK